MLITEGEVLELLDLAAAIDAVERALEREASGRASTMVKTHVAWGEGHTLHAVGGVDEVAGVVGTKTWAHTAGGARPVLILWDAATGERLAIVEAFALGQLRTAAMSGVATRRLASADVAEVAVIGAGKQALPQVRALAAVLSLARVRVFSRDRQRRDDFARTVERETGVAAISAPSVAAATDGAGVVTTVTRATDPFLAASMLDAGAHVNAVGAITPERAELCPDTVARAGVIAADSVESAMALASELAAHHDRIRSLSSVTGRGGADLTLFKAMGIGLADVALGTELLARKDGA